MFMFGFPIALGITAAKNGSHPPHTPITSFTLFVVPGPGRTAAQICPGQLLLGALLVLAYEPQLQLAILSWPIEAKFL